MKLLVLYECWKHNYGRQTEGPFRTMAYAMNMHQERLAQASGAYAMRARSSLGPQIRGEP